MTMDQHPLPDGTANGRVWIAQLLAASSYMAFNDGAGTGSTWTRSLTGPGQVHGVDNQSIAAGPYPGNAKPSTARAGADYPHALYYCSHEAVNAFCSRSDDGGAHLQHQQADLRAARRRATTTGTSRSAPTARSTCR